MQTIKLCLVSGSHHGVHEDFWDTTQRKLVVKYRRFGTICRSHFQG